MPPNVTKPPGEKLATVFEQRAEYLSKAELEQWTVYTPRDEALIQKLIGPGAKLLTGPRGSGKSTLFRTAYFRALAERECFAVYVNYSASLALEPLLHKQANALQVFRQWVLYKIVDGARRACDEMGSPMPSGLEDLALSASKKIQRLEAGFIDESASEIMSPAVLAERLESWASALDLSRCVLLLDDAAHAFSPEQQRDFFEIFRTIRSRRVSPKAAVYPGITSYSPNFHVGHEAELLEAWYRSDAPEFLTAMHDVVQRRLPESMRAHLKDKQDLIDLLALASFGLPRGFINMLSQLLGVEEGAGNSNPTRLRADEAIRTHVDSVRTIFKGLSAKLPRYRHFVEMGLRLEQESLETLRRYNAIQRAPEDKTTTVALKEPLGAPLERILNLLEYAGVIRAGRTVSRGIKGRFQRYTLHNAIVMSENALALGKSYSIAQVVGALSQTSSHSFTRTSGPSLLGQDFEAKCTLALPSCKNVELLEHWRNNGSA